MTKTGLYQSTENSYLPNKKVQTPENQISGVFKFDKPDIIS